MVSPLSSWFVLGSDGVVFAGEEEGRSDEQGHGMSDG